MGGGSYDFDDFSMKLRFTIVGKIASLPPGTRSFPTLVGKLSVIDTNGSPQPVLTACPSRDADGWE